MYPIIENPDTNDIFVFCHLNNLLSFSIFYFYCTTFLHLTIKAKQSWYALRILRSHGLLGDCSDVVSLCSSIVGSMLYCSAVWWGFTDAQERGALEEIIRKLVRLGFLPLSTTTFEALCNKADSNLFACILNSPCHVLPKLLPPIRITRYSLRPRSHNRELPVFNYLSKKCFRMLYI